MRKLIAATAAAAVMALAPATSNAEPVDKVTICHKGQATLSVDANALFSPHLFRHGDTLGPCP